MGFPESKRQFKLPFPKQNVIESLDSSDKKLNRQRSVFPSEKALLKALYLATLQATKKWTIPLRNWGKVYGEFSIEGKFTEKSSHTPLFTP